LLCYSTGRFKDEVYDIVDQRILPKPDYLICAVGTRLYKGHVQEEILSFRKNLEKGWNLEKVEQIMAGFDGILHQPEKYQNNHKSSWYLLQDDPILVEKVKSAFRDNGMNVTIIYSSGRDLDILPAQAGKGKALKWMCSKLSIPLKKVIVAGNTGNDTSMFLINGVKGIVVSNAEPELHQAVNKDSVFRATRSIADGVIEGLRYFGMNLTPSTSSKRVLVDLGRSGK
jgi:sucrose-6F-phosphate phosphohydrolase